MKMTTKPSQFVLLVGLPATTIKEMHGKRTQALFSWKEFLKACESKDNKKITFYRKMQIYSPTRAVKTVLWSSWLTLLLQLAWTFQKKKACLPDDWQLAIITALEKKQERKAFTNGRGDFIVYFEGHKHLTPASKSTCTCNAHHLPATAY